jgi:hypothetical protein
METTFLALRYTSAFMAEPRTYEALDKRKLNRSWECMGRGRFEKAR